MPAQFMHFFILYGYLAIFLTVFLQEIGIPTIVPNELSLFFFGYLSYQGNLNLCMVLAIVILSEMAGTLFTYAVFYLFGSILIRNRPSWLPLPLATISKFKSKIIKRGGRAIFIGRMNPLFARIHLCNSRSNPDSSKELYWNCSYGRDLLKRDLRDGGLDFGALLAIFCSLH